MSDKIFPLYFWTFENMCNEGGTTHERLGKKRLYVLTQLFYSIVIETSKNKHISQYLAQKMSQYRNS